MLRFENVVKKAKDFVILNEVNFHLNKGEIVSLVGESGSGKSTILHIAGLISSIDSGKIIINGSDCTNSSEDEKDKLRSRIGFIYQFHHLLPEFTILENLVIPQVVSGVRKGDAQEKAAELLDRFNLLNIASQKPESLSGGQNQRIAVLRAFIKNPFMVLADEPTGNLDRKNADEVFDFILQESKRNNISTLIVTHNLDLAEKSDRIVKMDDINNV
jgi:lipoprotein-releasing system ATP-binding protein